MMELRNMVLVKSWSILNTCDKREKNNVLKCNILYNVRAYMNVREEIIK